jgi:hypothetical protein
MGIGNWSRSWVFLAALMASPVGFANADDVSLGRQAWPAQTVCAPCVPLQFGVLQFQLPLANVGNLLVLGSDTGGVHIFPGNRDPAASLLLGSIRHENLVGLFENSGLLSRFERLDNETFFDRLGVPADASSPLGKLRRINGLARAKRYLKASRGVIHAYSIQSDPPVAEAVYFVIDGDPTVYSLMGRVTPQLFELFLSNLQVAPIP